MLKTAAFALAEAKFIMGDFNQHILHNVDKTMVRIYSKKDNVAGAATDLSLRLFVCFFNRLSFEFPAYESNFRDRFAEDICLMVGCHDK